MRVAPTLDWMGNDYDIVVLLHPTNPIRDWKHIDEAVSRFGPAPRPLASVEYSKRSYRHNASIYAAKVPFTALYGDKTFHT
jgi:CMP-N-acetylneuraminic acid synthetase